MYRTTPHDSLPRGQSPAEALMGRKLRTVHTALMPNYLSRNTPAKKITALDVGTRVYVRDNIPGNKRWKDGYILKQIGNVMYDVQVGRDIWIRHLNQIRPSMIPMNDKNDQHLHLDLLLDTFQLQPSSAPVHKEQSKSTPKKSDPVLQSRRWTDGRRKATERFQVNPRQVRY